MSDTRLLPLDAMAAELGIPARSLRIEALSARIPCVRVGETSFVFNPDAVRRTLLERLKEAEHASSRAAEGRDASPDASVRTPVTQRSDAGNGAVAPAAFDARAAAAFVGVSCALWLRLVASGRAPRGMKLGARRVWSRVELAAWIEAGAPALVRWDAQRTVKR